MGVIVRMEKETFKVLSQHGKELSVPQHAVQPRKTRAVALDCHQVRIGEVVTEEWCPQCLCPCVSQNSIAAKDVVRVVKGLHVVSKSLIV